MKNFKWLVVAIMGAIVMTGCGNGVGEDSSLDKSFETSVEGSVIESKDEGIQEKTSSSKEAEIESAEENVFSITGKWCMIDVEGGYVEFREDGTGTAWEDGTDTIVDFEYEIDLMENVVYVNSNEYETEVLNISEEDGIVTLGSWIIREADFLAMNDGKKNGVDYEANILGKWIPVNGDLEGEAYIEFFEDNVAVMYVGENSEKTVIEYKIDAEKKVVVLYDTATNEEVEVNIVEENGRIILQNEYDTCVHENDYRE